MTREELRWLRDDYVTLDAGVDILKAKMHLPTTFKEVSVDFVRASQTTTEDRHLWSSPVMQIVLSTLGVPYGNVQPAGTRLFRLSGNPADSLVRVLNEHKFLVLKWLLEDMKKRLSDEQQAELTRLKAELADVSSWC